MLSYFSRFPSLIPVTMTSPSHPSRTACPLCDQQFVRLGNHLPHCKQRHNQDYSSYLSQKTRQKRATRGTKSRKTCSKCKKAFLRLDTHLRRNAFCRSLPSVQSAQSPSPDNQDPATDSGMGTSAHQLAADPSTAPPVQEDLTASFPSTKPALKLPASEEAWREADDHFKVELIPAVLEMSCPEEKNEVLSEGIYSYFAGKYGCKVQHHAQKQKRNNKSHNRVLSSVTQQLKEARREFRQSK